MTIGFFTVLRRDPQHALHADGLVASARAAMPGVSITHFTDEQTPAVTGVDAVRRLPAGPMLERRIEHYAACDGDWLLLDTDVQIQRDVSDVFSTGAFDVALADRNWRDYPQPEAMYRTMPYNTGVCFSRAPAFWTAVLAVWRSYPREQRDWMSEQRAVYAVICSGAFRVKILPGDLYNYPPRGDLDRCAEPYLVHYKGDRKVLLTERIRAAWQIPASV